MVYSGLRTVNDLSVIVTHEGVRCTGNINIEFIIVLVVRKAMSIK